MTNLSFLVHLSSKDSKEIHPTNSPADFYVHLPYVVHLPGAWVCAIEALYVTQKPTTTGPNCLHAELDFVRSSIAYGREARIGGTFEFKVTRSRSLKELVPKNTKGTPVDAQELSRIRVRLLTDELEECTFFSGETAAVLRFTRVEKTR